MTFEEALAQAQAERTSPPQAAPKEGAVPADIAMSRAQEEARTGRSFGDAGPISPNGGEPTMGQRTLGVLADIVPGAGSRAMRDQYQESGQRPGLVDRQIIGATEAMTGGLLGRFNAFSEGLEQRSLGQEPEPFGVRLGREREFLDENSGLGGQIVGSFTPGGPVERAATVGGRAISAIPFARAYGMKGVAARGAANIGLGATMTAAYAGAQGKSTDDILFEAMVGGGFSGVMSGASDVLTAIGRSEGFRESLGRASPTEVAETLIRNFRDTMPANVVDNMIGEGYLDISSLSTRLAQSDAPLIENFPEEVMGEAMRVMNAAKAQDGRPVYSAVRFLNEYLLNRKQMALPEFQDRLATAVSSPTPRSLSEVDYIYSQERAALHPRYTQVLNNLDHKVMKNGQLLDFNHAAYNNMVTSAFSGAQSGPARAAMRDVLRYAGDQLPTVDAPAGPGPNPNAVRGPNTIIRGRTLQEAIHAMDSAIYTGKPMSSTDVDSIDKDVIMNYMIPLRNQLKQVLYDMDPSGQFANLDAQYAQTVNLTRAHQAGFDAMRGPSADSYSFDIFQAMRGGASPAEMEAFTEGVKTHLVQQLNGATSANAINSYFTRNARKMALVESVAPGLPAQLQENAQLYAAAAAIGKMAIEPSQVPARMQPGGGPRAAFGAAADAGLGAAASAGQLSTGALSGMLRRTVPNIGEAAVPAGYPGRASEMASMLMKPTNEALPLLNQILEQSAPAPGGVPTMLGPVAGGAMNPGQGQ